MAQTKFKVEDGLQVRGQANVTGALRVEGPLTLLDNVATGMTVTGNVNPQTDGAYTLGNTTHRWVLYAAAIDTSQPFVSTNTAFFGNNITLSGNVTLTSNGTVIGSETTRAIVYTSNAYVSDTLVVANAGSSFLTVNNTAFVAQSNLQSNGSALTLSSNTFGLFLIQSNNLTIATGLPSTIIDEFNKTAFTSAKYFIQARDNATNNMYTSEALVMFHAQTNTAYFSEYNQVFNSTRFLNFTAATTASAIRLVANGTATNVTIRAVRTAVL